MTIILPHMSFEKSVTEHRSFLRGASEATGDKDWLIALKAFDFARQYHTGMRKDGKSHEFSHQIFQANYARTLLSGIMHPAKTLAVIYLHDICEDYDVSFETIEAMFGKDIRDGVEAMTKKYKGIVIPYDVYFARLAQSPTASIAKGFDRGHNIFTMGDTDWTVAKQTGYLKDITDWFLPMNKAASRNFPEQGAVHENIKSLLTIQAKHIHDRLEVVTRVQTLEAQIAGLTTPLKLTP